MQPNLPLAADRKLTPGDDTSSKIHIAGALMKTLESILPHAAISVETESSKLSETIQGLLKQLTLQEQIIEQLVNLLNHVELKGEKLSIDEFLNFLHCTLAFSLEKNLLLTEYVSTWTSFIHNGLIDLNKVKLHLEKTEGMDSTTAKTLGNIMSQMVKVERRLDHLSTSCKEKISHENDLQVLNTLIEKAPDKRQALAQLIAQADASKLASQELASQSIVAMQFQDRNTQIMDNAVRLLRQYRELIDDCSHDQAYLDVATHKLLQNFYSNIQMSDIRAIFIKALEGEHIPFPGTGNKPANQEDDIEIF